MSPQSRSGLHAEIPVPGIEPRILGLTARRPATVHRSQHDEICECNGSGEVYRLSRFRITTLPPSSVLRFKFETYFCKTFAAPYQTTRRNIVQSTVCIRSGNFKCQTRCHLVPFLTQAVMKGIYIYIYMCVCVCVCVCVR